MEDGQCSRDIMVIGKEGERRKILTVYDFSNVFFNNYVMRVEWYFACTNQIAALGLFVWHQSDCSIRVCNRLPH